MKEYRVKVYENRTELYNQLGKLHREDGPAIEWADGTKFWYLNGECHREDGPAVEFANGTKKWYLNGEHLSEAEFNQRVQKEVVVTMDEVAEKMGIPVELLKIKK